jgi:uncharacterized protein YndB with AHSA1/START domain
MGRISVAIDIDAPPAEVWRVIEPLEDHPDWMHDAVSVRFATDQTRGIGTRTIVETKVGPFRLTDHMTVTEWEPGAVMGVEHTGVVTGTGRFTLRSDGRGGTTFSWDEGLRFPWWLGGPLGGLVGGRLLAAVWRRNLRDLKARVEERRTDPGPGG